MALAKLIHLILLLDQIGTGAAIVGKITRLLMQTASRSTDIILVDDTGQYPTVQLDLQFGFKHF
jgi:hypothetical protein